MEWDFWSLKVEQPGGSIYHTSKMIFVSGYSYITGSFISIDSSGKYISISLFIILHNTY